MAQAEATQGARLGLVGPSRPWEAPPRGGKGAVSLLREKHEDRTLPWGLERGQSLPSRGPSSNEERPLPSPQ